MKKYITFNNILLVVALGIFLMELAPCVCGKNAYSDEAIVCNLFKMTFGGTITAATSTGTFTLVPCAGLIIAFICVIFALINSLLKNRFKFGSLLATPFYITAGILIACTKGLVTSANYMSASGTFIKQYYVTGWTIAIACMFCIIGAFSLIDAIVSLAKPKAKEVY